MSLQVSKETGVVYDPVFLKILEDIPGGVTIKTNRFPTTTDEIKKGAMLNASASSVGLYNLVKTARVIHAVLKSTLATIMYLDPDNEFIVGEVITYGATASAQTITKITKGAVSDLVVIANSMILAIASAGVLYETANKSSVAKYDTDAILRSTVKVRDDEGTLLDNIFAGVVVRGTVDESELPYFVTDQQKTDLTARIRFA